MTAGARDGAPGQTPAVLGFHSRELLLFPPIHPLPFLVSKFIPCLFPQLFSFQLISKKLVLRKVNRLEMLDLLAIFIEECDQFRMNDHEAHVMTPKCRPHDCKYKTLAKRRPVQYPRFVQNSHFNTFNKNLLDYEKQPFVK